MHESPRSAPPGTWLLYDGNCGICSRVVLRAERLLNRYGVHVTPLQSDWVAQVLPMPPSEIVSDIRLITSSGRHLHGPDVYREILKRIWWTYPLYLISRMPGCKQVFNWTYRTIAANRHRISQTCGIAAPHSVPHPAPRAASHSASR